VCKQAVAVSSSLHSLNLNEIEFKKYMCTVNDSKMSKLQHFIFMHFARSVARDVGGSDPERMAPRKVEEYIREVFKNTDIMMEVISDPIVLRREYPLFVAVDRAARSEFCLEFGCMFYFIVCILLCIVK
jgi:leucyl aminopeptidase